MREILLENTKAPYLTLFGNSELQIRFNKNPFHEMYILLIQKQRVLDKR